MERYKLHDTLKNMNIPMVLSGTIGTVIGMYLGYKLGEARIEAMTQIIENESILENLIKYSNITKISTSIIGGTGGYIFGLGIDKFNSLIMDSK